MSTLTSIKDGSLGTTHMSAYQDGTLGGAMFEGMVPVSGFRGMQPVKGLGCGCATSGLGEYFSGVGILPALDTTPKQLAAAAVAAGLLYFVGKKAKLIPNKRRKSRRRKSRRSRR